MAIQAEGSAVGVPLRRKARAWALVALFSGMMLGLTYGGVVRMARAFGRGVAWDDRAWFVATAVALLVPPGWMAWVFLKQKLTSGRWTKTREERIQAMAQCRVNAGGVRATQWSWLPYAVRWSDCHAMDTAAPRWKRVVGWAGVVVLVLGVALIGLMGLVSIGAAFADDNTLTASCVFLGIAVGLLMVPAFFVRACLRRKRETGSIHFTRDELVDVEQKKAAWELRESQRSLKFKVISTLVSAVILGWVWKRYTGRGDWTFPTMITGMAVHGAWIQFRRPKNVAGRGQV